jgi:hypothetical protein
MNTSNLRPRTFDFPGLTPVASNSFRFCIGRKGASWWIVTTRGIGMRRGPRAREQACLNVLGPAYPPPTSSTAEKQIFVLFPVSGDPNLSHTRVRDVLVSASIVRETGRTFPASDHFPGQQTIATEVELLLQPTEYLKACEGCGNWENLIDERYKRCGSCKARFYCSEQVRFFDTRHG